MFLYKKESHYVRTAKLNKEKYEEELKRYNAYLKNKNIPSKDKLDYLIKRGNILLNLIPSRNSYNTKKRYLEEAKKTYDLASKSIKPIEGSLKKKKDLERAINQIIDKQKNLKWKQELLESSPYYSKTIVLLIFVSFLSSLFFLSMNLTGAVTGTAKSDFSFLGIILFIAGLITAFIYFRNERKRFEKMGVI